MQFPSLLSTLAVLFCAVTFVEAGGWVNSCRYHKIVNLKPDSLVKDWVIKGYCRKENGVSVSSTPHLEDVIYNHGNNLRGSDTPYQTIGKRLSKKKWGRHNNGVFFDMNINEADSCRDFQFRAPGELFAECRDGPIVMKYKWTNYLNLNERISNQNGNLDYDGN